MSSIEQAMTEHVGKEFSNRLVRDPQAGLLIRAQAVLEETARQEEQLKELLDKLRGSNIARLNESPKEPAPAGLPGIYDQLERRQKNSAKLLQDLSDMF